MFIEFICHFVISSFKVQMEDSQETSDKVLQSNEESQDSQDDAPETIVNL